MKYQKHKVPATKWNAKLWNAMVTRRGKNSMCIHLRASKDICRDFPVGKGRQERNGEIQVYKGRSEKVSQYTTCTTSLNGLKPRL